MTTTTQTARPSTAQMRSPQTLAILGGAGHVAAQRFHTELLTRLLDHAPIATDADLPDVVHLGYGLGAPDGHFTTQQTTDWLVRNARMLTAIEPTLVVAICNTIQPTLHTALGTQWPVLDNLAVVQDAADTMQGHRVWLASQGAYTQGLFPHPGDALAALAEAMILAGMNNSPDPSHADRLLNHLTATAAAETSTTGVVLACTDLTAYAPLLRARGVRVVDAVEALAAATLARLTAAALTCTASTDQTLPAPAFEEAVR